MSRPVPGGKVCAVSAAQDRPRETKIDTSPARGMRDILPDEAAVRDRAMATILDVYRRHGFVRIETPAVENLRL
jgi:histidyl-tRNA synthetase